MGDAERHHVPDLERAVGRQREMRVLVVQRLDARGPPASAAGARHRARAETTRPATGRVESWLTSRLPAVRIALVGSGRDWT